MTRPWHSVTLDTVFQTLETSERGLASVETEKRLRTHGRNVLPRERSYSKLRLFIRQFNSPLIFILLVASGISLYLKHYSDTIFIVIVLLLNTSVGFYQENKADASLKALRSMVRISARVLRDGNRKEVDSTELVPGDIVYLKRGDKVPADARLIEQKGLRVDESSLTGEWVAVSKSVGELPENTPLAERTAMVYMGSIVEDGSAIAVVTDTGSQTAIGAIVSLLKETKERPTPLQKKISLLSEWIGGFILVVVVLVTVLGYVRGEPFSDIFVTALALAVSAIPEGLLPAVTIILALGMRRILKENGLVRKLIANETLGSVTVICTDKTGTLTEGRMQVSHILTGTHELLNNTHEPRIDGVHANGFESHSIALKTAVLSNDAFIENPDDAFHEWIVRGLPTEQAFLIAGMHAGFSRKTLEQKYARLDRLEFNSESKYSASLYGDHDGKKTLYVTGAPEVLFTRSAHFHVDGALEDIGSDMHKKLLAKLESLTTQGLRVVACAYREFPKSAVLKDSLEENINHLTLVGYIALKDPLREDARDSIAIARGAGIRTVIITGDHRLTAQSIANEAGIIATDEMILEGKDLDALSEEELIEKVPTVTIYARVSPSHKLRIVQALQKHREVVAMLGDGVNDAPALKAADVGIAIGSGSDVAKEVADVVLLDANLKTVVRAIEQGRIIFQNIRKVFVYLVADDFSEMFLFLAAMAFGLPLPLLAAQILWINLVEDGLPNIALTAEQETSGIMSQKPRHPDEPILNAPIRKWMTAIFFITGLSAFLSFFLIGEVTGDIERTRSIIFALVCLNSLWFAFSLRSFTMTIFRRDILSNRLLTGAVGIGILLLLAGLYLPPLQIVLSAQPLIITEWLLIGAISLAEISLIEWFKVKIFVNTVPALA